MKASTAARSLFDFEDPAEYLNHLRCHYPGLKKPIHLERWAQSLGFKSSRSIEHFLSGKRLPSHEMIVAISATLKWSERERRYFETLVRRARYLRRAKPVTELDSELHRLRTQSVRPVYLDQEVTRYISDWHHLAIKQLIESPGFQPDPAWIRKRLRGKVTLREIHQAIRTMHRLGIIDRPDLQDPKRPPRVNPASKVIYTPEDVPSLAVRSHHRQMLTRASEAIDEQEVTQREFISMTLRMDPKHITEFKRLLRELRDRINSDFSSNSSDRVYQVNFQFFEHTTFES